MKEERDDIFKNLAQTHPEIVSTLTILKIWWESLPVGNRPTHYYMDKLCTALAQEQKSRDALIARK